MKKIFTFILLLASITAVAQYGVWTIRLVPGSFLLEVSNGLPLKLEVNNELPLRLKAETTNITRYGLGWWLGSTTPKKPEWTVNGIVNGNNLVGQITMKDEYQIIFKAPLHKPDKNPVEVIAIYKDIHLNGKIFDTSITCHIEIFGEWAIRLDPDSAWLRINDTLPLRIVNEFKSENKIKATSYGIGWWVDSVTSKKPEWTVNGIVNGNNEIGQIIMNGKYHITFKAPIHKPVKNPVEVIAAYKDVYMNNKNSDRRITSIIYIVDSLDKSREEKESYDTIQIKNKVNKDRFEVKMVATLIGGSKAAWGGIVTYRDEGSFIVSLEAEKVAVTNIKNNLEVVTNDCAKIILNPTTCTGMLHVAGVKATNVTPANPPGQSYPIVEIWFVQYPTELTQFRFTCPPPPSAQKSSIGKVDLSQMAMLAMSRMPALPPYIKFIAKNEEQIILEKGSPGSEIYYKFSVRKLKEDD